MLDLPRGGCSKLRSLVLLLWCLIVSSLTTAKMKIYICVYVCVCVCLLFFSFHFCFFSFLSFTLSFLIFLKNVPWKWVIYFDFIEWQDSRFFFFFFLFRDKSWPISKNARLHREKKHINGEVWCIYHGTNGISRGIWHGLDSLSKTTVEIVTATSGWNIRTLLFLTESSSILIICYK